MTFPNPLLDSTLPIERFILSHVFATTDLIFILGLENDSQSIEIDKDSFNYMVS